MLSDEKYKAEVTKKLNYTDRDKLIVFVESALGAKEKLELQVKN